MIYPMQSRKLALSARVTIQVAGLSLKTGPIAGHVARNRTLWLDDQPIMGRASAGVSWVLALSAGEHST